MRRWLTLLGLLFALPVASAEPEAVLRLPDGREVHGTSLKREKAHVVLETVFGPLRVPKALLKKRPRTTPDEPETPHTAPAPETPPEDLRETRSTWFVIESDLVTSRVERYHELLDAFVEWMMRVYELDEKRLRARAPFRMQVFRSREDFKRVQAAVAPSIAQHKGQGFAEGVAGFYSPGNDTIYMWDSDAGRMEDHPTTAIHETTHLLNHRLSEATGIRFPVWFEEGTAVYFQTWLPGAIEPEPSLAALVTVVGDIEGGRARSNRALRSVTYGEFLSPEYAWGWSLVHFLRRGTKPKTWASLLDYLRTIGRGPPSDSENRRFLKALRFKRDETLDKAWHAHVLALKPKGKTPLGASAASLKDVAALEAPTPEQAALFRKIGVSFLKAGVLDAAVVYLQAALRGHEDDVELRLGLARALAEQGGATEDEAWPAEALGHIEQASRLDPLSVRARVLLGRQMLARAEGPAGAAKARDLLGLALLLLGPADDDKSVAKWALVATLDADPDLEPKQVLQWLLERAPRAERALGAAWVYFLQEREEWEVLLETLERRAAADEAAFEEREILAGLLFASDRLDEASRQYEALIAARPDAYHLWPHLIRVYLQAGRLDDAKKAKARAFAALEKAPPELAPLRRVVHRIRLP